MQILFVAPRFHTNQYELVKNLKRDGHYIIFHVSLIRNTENHTSIKPIRFRRSKISLFIKKFKNKSTNDFWYIPSFSELNKIIRTILSSDLIIVRSFNRPQSVIYILISIVFRKKIFLYTQGELNKLKKYENFLISKLFYFLNLYWITPINNLTSMDNSINSRIFFAPFVCEKKFFKRKISPDKNSLNFLSIGKYEKRKNHDLTIRALKVFSKIKKIKINLTIVGQCFKKDEILYFNKLKLANKNTNNLKINFLKNIHHSNVSNLYKRNQFFILLSENEPAAYSPLEAISYGLITIGSEENGTFSYIKESPFGIVTKLDLKEIINTLEKAYKKYKDQELNESIFLKTTYLYWKKCIYKHTRLKI